MIWPLGAFVAEVRAPAPTISIVFVRAGNELMPTGAFFFRNAKDFALLADLVDVREPATSDL